MIVYDLHCRDGGHRFEGWFGSSDDFARQKETGLLACPTCGSSDVDKAVMAPAVGRKGNQMLSVPTRSARGALSDESEAAVDKTQGVDRAQAVANLPPEAKAALVKLAEMQKAVLEKSRWVGRKFAEEARAIHYGEADAEPIYGEASGDEAEELAEEGIEIAPLPFPVAPPKALN